MSRLRRPRGGTVLPLLLSLCWVACSRPGSNQGASDAGQHQVPFREGGESETADLSPTSSSPPAEQSEGPGTGVPFRYPQSLPAGTLLTVRLKDPISSNGAAAGGAFAAIVDEPVVIEGETVVPRGASVAGRVESARPSTMNRNQGYLRLSLDKVDIAGRGLPIRTSSLFARGTAREPQPDDASVVVVLEQGRRLTFRLTEPLDVVSKAAIPSR